MLRKLLVMAAVCLVSAGTAFAQTGTITGTVTDAKTGEALPGANVLVVGTSHGAATNAQGEYTITDVPTGKHTVRVTFIGYNKAKKKVTVSSGTVELNFQLSSGVNLNEVVVSALGFKEQKDELGTSESQVSGDNIAKSGETNLVEGLSAKAAGVNITSTSGDPGAASRIVIRGANTITGNNEPLFVVDGVPVYNSSIGTGVAGVAQQSRINDLNPEDIKSVEVLKGPSASALWGSRAANGVVLITTKSGTATKGNKVNISVTSKYSIDELNKTVNLQRKYGQGIGGSYVPGYFLSWGDKISDRSGKPNVVDKSNGNAYYTSDGTKHGLITQKNSTQTYDHGHEIFHNGFKANNSISFSGGNNDGTFRLSVSNLTQNGIILNNSDYDRTTLHGTASRNFNKLTAKVNVQYSDVSSNRIQRGSNVSGLLLGAYRTPPDFNNRPYTVDYVASDGSIIPDRHRSFRNPVGATVSPKYNNPLWTIHNDKNHSRVKRIQGNTELSYDPTQWLNITHRLGIDTYTDRRYAVFPIYDASNPSGALTEREISQYQLNSDLIAKASHTFNENFSGSLTLGWNLNHRHYDNVQATSTDIILSSFNRSLSNYNSKNPTQYRSTVRTSALYSVVDFNAYDMLYLELTGRQESASTFGPQTDATFFYPSGNIAFQFSDLDIFDDSILSFGKLRASYGEAGVQPPVYSTSTPFFQGTFASGWGDGLNPAEYGGGFARSGQAGNPKLKVERTKEYEIGGNFRFFDDRVELDLTRYWTKTEDAILGVDRAPSSGFGSQTANAASLENKGLEAELNIDLIRSNNFNWRLHGTWSKNINTVTSLAGANEVALAGFTSATSSAIVNHQYGILFGNQWRRASEFPLSSAEKSAGYTVGKNDRVLDPNGFPVAADEQGIIGNPNPDWRAGIGSTISFKNLTLDFLFDIKQGGDVWNGTKGALYFFGVHGDQTWQTTAQQDLTTYGGGTIKKGTTFRGYVKDFGAGPVAVTESYFYAGPGSGFTGPAEPFVEDGGYVRLRRVRLGYSISGKRFRDATGLRSINLSVTGRNVFLITDYSGIDPETNLTGPSNGFGLDYFNNPSTRSWMFSVSINY